MATVEEIREFGDNTEHLSNGLLGPLGIEAMETANPLTPPSLNHRARNIPSADFIT